ncbi:methylenetetrahydrofolate reductase [NAD(P)H] [Hydrogenobaculum acidophilum]
MKIIELLKSKKGVSFEFFPPKNQKDKEALLETAKELIIFNPIFVSVTHGASGSSTSLKPPIEYTKETVLELKNSLGLNVMAHLTCIAHTKDEILEILGFYRKNDIENILALRGDIPKNGDKRGCSHAKELIELIKEHFDDEFCIGVAAYPEGHPESPNMEWEIKYFKQKVEAGASFAITQMFFDNTYYYEFLDLCHKVNIDIPIIPGIMPITNIKQISKFASMCGATIPYYITDTLENLNDEDVVKKGVEIAINQCEDLIKNGVKHIHFYTLNKSKATLDVLKAIKL